MDLIERYLGAVRWNLPGDKADDILAELSDLIAARIEDREEALGRPLDREELGQLLREFGHPIAVAGQYHGQRALIGPELFPFYWFVLKIVLAVMVAVEAIQLVGRLVTSHDGFAAAFMHGFWNGASSLLVNAALVTLAFAVIERTGWLTDYLENWKPQDLPELPRLQLPDSKRGPWQVAGAAVMSIAFCAAFLAWWFGAIDVPVFPRDARVVVQAAPVWTLLFWPVAALIATRMVLGLVTLLLPRWKPLRGALIVGCTVGTLAIVAVLHQAGRMFIVTGIDAEKVAKVQLGLDKSLPITLIVIAALTLFEGAKELWQLHRERAARA